MSKPLPVFDDTIAAVATACGPAGIGIVRMSGPLAGEILKKIFRPSKTLKKNFFRSHRIYHGVICDPLNGEIIDEVLAVLMAAPNSYTRENVVEIHCHGGLLPVRTILRLTVKEGARLAQPGEFTRRAFVNGRIDLVQAEAILDVIQARTKNSLLVGGKQLQGELTVVLEKIRSRLMDAYVRLEALVNFPEDGIEDQSREDILALLTKAKEQTASLLATSDRGRLLREGAKVVICGRPNVGKSSLLNVLLRQPRAIVSDVAGTTRDTIEEPAQIGSIPLQLIDTAGILEPRDAVEEEAVRRSRLKMRDADLILLTFMNPEKISDEDRHIAGYVSGQKILAVINKCDLPGQISEDEIGGILPGVKIVRVSVKTGDGIPLLEKAVEDILLSGQPDDPSQILLTNSRHIDSLTRAQRLTEESENGLKDGLSLEFVSEHLKDALACLDRVTGRDADEDLLDSIFSKFCIGK